MPQEKGSKEYALWKKKKPTLKAYASMAFENEFQQDIEKIVDLSHISHLLRFKMLQQFIIHRMVSIKAVDGVQISGKCFRLIDVRQLVFV